MSTLGRAVRTGMILGVTASAVGCATLHEAESADVAIDRGSADTLRSATGPEAVQFAQQAQRDVQQLQQLQERVDPTAPTASVSTRPVIQWIEPSPRPARARASAGITVRGEARSRPPGKPPPHEPEQSDLVVVVEPAGTAGEDRLRQLFVQLSA